MNNILKKVTLFTTIAIGIAFTFSSCKTKKDEDTSPTISFDKAGMLNNIATNVIIPAYADLKLNVDSLQFYANEFTSNANNTNLENLQNQFLKTYSAYQHCSSFEFGPAQDLLLRSSFNIFPCDTAQINNNIITGTYNLASADNTDAKGLPALDFLLFRSNKNSSFIISQFTGSSSANNAKNYLTALVNELKTKTDELNNEWSATGGNYITTFKSSTGNDVGSSISLLINQMNYDLELLKNAKVGIPLGKKTAGVPLPEKTEAYYSGKSLDMLVTHITSLENIYLGRNEQGSDALGLDDYLAQLDAPHASGKLHSAIKNKFTNLKTKLSAISNPLSDAVVNTPTTVDAAYSEILQLVVLLKIDLTAATGVLITYADNDGD